MINNRSTVYELCVGEGSRLMIKILFFLTVYLGCQCITFAKDSQHVGSVLELKFCLGY